MKMKKRLFAILLALCLAALLGAAVWAEDTGGFHGNHIDVAFDTHGEALAFGRQNLEIYILD